MRSSLSLFARIGFVGVLFGSVAAAQVREVLVGQTADRSVRAFLSVDEGLVVRGWRSAPKRTLAIGHGSEPRFDADGNLYFTRSFDDGYVETGRETWVVAAGQTRARKLAATEKAPAYVLPPIPKEPSGAPVKIAVDAGHGGSDSGAVGNGLLEKTINLDVAVRLNTLLTADTNDARGGGEWSVLMTRTTDVFVSLVQRSNLANAFGARSFLSIHMNAFGDSSANGTETFCYLNQQNNAGGRYRNRLQAEALAAWGLRDRGVKTANFSVLRRTTMPAALVEGGFVTNATDAAKMRDANSRQRLALGLLYATQEHHGFRRYNPGGSTGQQGTLRGVVYDATRGTGVRIAGALVALSDGRFTFSSSNGAFSFRINVGSYRYAATRAGFDAAGLSRTVVANQDVWGSVGLRPANVPSLSVPSAPRAGTTVTMTVRGDGRSPALLLLNSRPGLPNPRISSYGLLWPRLASLLALNLGTIPTSGSLAVRLRLPNVRGFRLHMQTLVLSNRALRLSNGAALLTQ